MHNRSICIFEFIIQVVRLWLRAAKYQGRVIITLYSDRPTHLGVVGGWGR